jgi:hypothetical protein
MVPWQDRTEIVKIDVRITMEVSDFFEVVYPNGEYYFIRNWY